MDRLTRHADDLFDEGRRDLGQGRQGLQEVQRRFRMFDPEDFLSDEALQALFDRAGVGFRGQMAGLQARNERRGIRGPLSGALEGDLMSAQQRNLLATTADFANRRASLELAATHGLQGAVMPMLDLGFASRAQGIDILAGNRDAQVALEQARREEAAARRRGIGSGLGSLLGAGIGTIIAPGLGTAIGASIGGQAGSGFGDLFG